jgi:hypothetical protein
LQVSQTDFKAAALLYKEGGTLNPLGFLKQDILAVSLLKSPTAGVVQAALRTLERSGSTRHPYLQVLLWMGKMQRL